MKKTKNRNITDRRKIVKEGSMKFGSRYVWGALQLLSGAVAIWIAAKFTAGVIRYVSYPNCTNAKVIQWAIIEINPDQFKISATYEFTLNQGTFTSRHLFADVDFRNRYAAEEVARAWANKEWVAWYRPSASPNSTLVKVFPLKTGLHFLIAFAIFFYFYWLKSYLYGRLAHLEKS